MPFPFSASGTIAIDKLSSSELDRVIAAVEDAIRSAKPTTISRHNEQINFQAGFFRTVYSWNQLVAISAGELHFMQMDSRIEIHYRISFVQLFIVVTACVGLMFGVIPILSGDRIPLEFCPLAWLWLFGGNYLITLIRFRRYLRAAAEKSQAGRIT